MSNRWGTPASVFAGAAAAIGASACCAGPLLLVMLGVGGASASNLVALEPLQPVFMLVALAFFGLAFRRLYLAPTACAPGEACAVPALRHRQRIVFWVVFAIAAALMALPLYAPLFY